MYLFFVLSLFSVSNISYAFAIDSNLANDAIFNVSYVAGALISTGAIMMGVRYIVDALSK